MEITSYTNPVRLEWAANYVYLSTQNGGLFDMREVEYECYVVDEKLGLEDRR